MGCGAGGGGGKAQRRWDVFLLCKPLAARSQMGQSHCILQRKSRCLLYYRNNTPPSLSLTITTYFGEQLTIGNEGRGGVLKQPSFSRCYTPTDSMTLSVLTFWTLVKSTIVLLRAVFIPHSVRQLKRGFNSTRREDIQHSISLLY